MFFVNISVWAQDESVAPGINEEFKERPEKWIEFFHFSSSDPQQQKEILDTLKLKPGMDIADVGAGSGVHVFLFAEKVLPDGKVYAVDIIQEFLDHIKAEGKEKGIKNIQCVMGSDTSCNLAPSSVDVVFTCDTYHHFEYPDAMLASINNALRPGGRLAIIDFRKQADRSSDWVMSHVRANRQQVIREMTAAGFELEREPDLLERNYFLIFRKQ